MKTSNLKKLAVGLLLVAGAFTAAPASQAETPVGYKRVSVAFAFNPEAPAEKIYSDLQRRARKACTWDAARPLALRVHDQKCVDEMVSSGVAQFGRADIAELHKGRITVASR